MKKLYWVYVRFFKLLRFYVVRFFIFWKTLLGKTILKVTFASALDWESRTVSTSDLSKLRKKNYIYYRLIYKFIAKLVIFWLWIHLKLDYCTHACLNSNINWKKIHIRFFLYRVLLIGNKKSIITIYTY